ncbi:MAG TPA: hypothetical protein VFM19_08760 [Candidatus Limnocylindria bacterium]|nr:hypothetical protein [Candidatus Limnocylindria bacterium]
MDAFVIFKYLHIASMFFAVALALSGEIVVRRIAQSADVRAIRIAIERMRPIEGPLATGLFLAGAAFGFVAAVTGQIDLLRPWLIAAYAAFLGAMVLGITITDPWVGRLERAAAASPDGAASPELLAVIGEPRARMATWALQAIIALIVFLMVVKPLG